jgi:hypothetical protein
MSRSDDNAVQALVFRGIPPVLAEILRMLPQTMELSHPAAENRLYPGPGEADQGRLAADWKAFVEPDLQQAFGEARQTVATDLAAMKETKKDGLVLRIPLHHRDAWLSVLTQVRLSIAEVHKLTEEDLSAEALPEIHDPRDAALHRMNFYGLLCESIIRSFGDE